MLKMIQCDKFMTYGDMRPPIYFKEGLNTILGGANANNSIGKSTLLLIIDFVFGGDTYLSSDAVSHVGVHNINFEFKFNNKSYFFSRDTVDKRKILKCDSFFNSIEKLDIDDFRNFLKEKYKLDFYQGSFRDLISRYFRIYGKDNYDEKRPLHSFPKETNTAAITSLEKLYKSYGVIEEYRSEFEGLSDKLDALKEARKQDVISYGAISKKTEYKENLKEIDALNSQLQFLTENNNNQYVDLNLQIADEISEIKTKLNNFLKDRTKIKSQLTLVTDNLTSNPEVHHGPYEELCEFFSNVNLKKLSEIEFFHSKISEILIDEYEQEAIRLENLLQIYDQEINKLNNHLSRHGEPANIPTSYLKKFTELNKSIEKLESQNKDYLFAEELNTSKKNAEEQLKKVEEGELRNIESTINEQMVRFNDEIYKRKRKAPIISLDSGKSYKFYTPDDTGTGTSYKSLVIFDLSVLETSDLPAIVHDSLLFKNMGDEPIDGIMKLYSHFDKQIFIAFDKDVAYSQETQKILHDSTVVQLDEGGNELFGRSWNVKE